MDSIRWSSLTTRDTLGSASVHDLNRVAIGDRGHLAGEIFGEQRGGGNCNQEEEATSHASLIGGIRLNT